MYISTHVLKDCVYLQSVLCFYYVHVCALKSVALITISLSMDNLLCGTIVVLGIGLPSVMWVSHQQKFATICLVHNMTLAL